MKTINVSKTTAARTTSAIGTSAEQRRGAVIPLAAIMLAVILAAVAFSVDIGAITLADTELQRTADACALAAVQRLPGKPEAIEAAQRLAKANAGFSGPDLAASDVHFGFWDRETATFSADNANVNAVQVTLNRTESQGNPLQLFFAHLMGTSHADISGTAIAMYDNNLCGPLIGVDRVYIPGGPTTDSFRSSLGSYVSQAPRDNGSVCSDGPINLEGEPIIYGDANAGKNSQTTLSGNSVVTGVTTPRLRPLNLPGVDTTGIETNNDNNSLPGIKKGNSLVSPLDGNRNFLLDGGATYDMPPGTYYFNNMTLTGNSTLNITGKTSIYLTGMLDTSGGYMVNTTLIASNLRIFMTGSTAVVTSKVDFYAVIYAPNTAVELSGSADFFGAAVGKTLTVTGSSDIHYDEQLELADTLNLPQRVSLVQ